MSDCLFCKIIEGVIPSTKVFEDEYVYAAFDDYSHKVCAYAEYDAEVCRL